MIKWVLFALRILIRWRYQFCVSMKQCESRICSSLFAIQSHRMLNQRQTSKLYVVMPKRMETDKNVMKRKWCYSMEISRTLHIFGIVQHITLSNQQQRKRKKICARTPYTCMVAKELLIIDYVRLRNEKKNNWKRKRKKNNERKSTAEKSHKMKENRTLNLTNMCALMGTFFQSNYSLQNLVTCYMVDE